MKFFPSLFLREDVASDMLSQQSQEQQLQKNQIQEHLSSIMISSDYEIIIANELKTETCKIKEALIETVELQNTLINQITIIDQENLDSIEKHIDNSISEMQNANNYLDASQNNVPSLINPFKNIMNIINLFTFWKKN